MWATYVKSYPTIILYKHVIIVIVYEKDSDECVSISDGTYVLLYVNIYTVPDAVTTNDVMHTFSGITLTSIHDNQLEMAEYDNITVYKVNGKIFYLWLIICIRKKQECEPGYI